jgi:hypothetical protein
MNAYVSTADRIGAADIANYLISHGWSRPEGISSADGYTIFVAPARDDHDRLIRIALPTRDDDPNIGSVIRRVLGLAAAIERRSEEEIASDMSSVAIDAMDIRIIPRVGGDGIPLRASPYIYGSVSELFSFGATVEARPAPVVGRRRPTNEPNPVNDFVLRPAERRSFAFRIETIMAGATQSLPGISENPEPIQRRVMSRIMRGLQRCMVATEGGWEKPNTEYKVGLNANMCESLVDLHNAVSGVDVEFSTQWSRKYPVPAELSGITSIRYTARMAARAIELASALRRIDGSELVELTGYIVGLNSKTSLRKKTQQTEFTYSSDVDFDPDYSLTVKASGRGVTPRHVHFSLPAKDYGKACDAHKETRKVRLVGRLKLHLGKWVFDPLKSFEPVTNK